MSEKYSTFVGGRETHHGMRSIAEHIRQKACRVVCVLGLLYVMMCTFTSCHWHEAKEVIAVADSLDQTEYVIYDDTAALGRTIRSLDNPFGRVLMSNTLGKAYYYMGRNYSLSDQIAEAAGCYIEADRLKIDDPIYRGRVNSCMGYICAQNNDNDSLALIFYKRANEHFQESSDKWYYAQTLLDRSEFNIYLHNYDVADSLLRIARSYQVDSAYRARYYETRGLYFYEKQEYDSALICFGQSLDYWQDEEAKCFSYLKIMQSYYFGAKDINNAIPYARLLVKHSVNPNYLSNAYYCLMQDAKEKDNTQLLSKYSHARTDALKLLRDNTNKYAEAIPKLMEYLQDPHPWRWVWVSFPIIIVLCLLLTIGIWTYRKRSCSANEQLDVLSTHIRTQEADILHQQSLLAFEKGLTEIMDKYHSPRNHWRNYSTLKKDIAPWLRNWTAKLDMLPLSEQEKIFCTISLIYPNLSDIEIANYMCYAKGSIRILKNRILKKIGISSSEFSNFLHNLSNCK